MAGAASTAEPAAQLQVPILEALGAGVLPAENTNRLFSRRPNVLLGVSGSVATIKMEELAEKLSAFANLKIAATRAAAYFFDNPKHGWAQQAHVDEDDWRDWKQVGDPILHIELRRWADLLVIAPLSANTLAKMAQGLCDNLLTSVVRAWDLSRPLLVAPAMNTMMWESPFTQKHLIELQTTLKVRTIPPVVKRLACGDVGSGAMAPVDEIVAAVKEELDHLESSSQV